MKKISKRCIKKAVMVIASCLCMVPTYRGYAAGEYIKANEYLEVSLESDTKSLNYGNFSIKAVLGNEDNISDNDKDLLYSNFNSSITMIKINGEVKYFGAGEDIAPISYDSENERFIHAQMFGEVKVTQILQFTKGFVDGKKDMIKVEYVLENMGEERVIAGVKVMLDIMLSRDDKGEILIARRHIMGEYELSEEELENEDYWMVRSVKSEETREEQIQGYGKLEGVDRPDNIKFVNWDNVYIEGFEYEIQPAELIEDSAVLYSWEEKELNKNVIRTVNMYYGVKNEERAIKDNGNTENNNSNENTAEIRPEVTKPNQPLEEEMQKPSTNETSERQPEGGIGKELLTGDTAKVIILVISITLSSMLIVILLRKNKTKSGERK